MNLSDFTTSHSTLITAILIPAILWMLGKFKTSTAYTAIRAKIGIAAFKAGEVVSGIGSKSILKPVWGPIEDVFSDWVLFLADQFSAGLRADNPEKLAAQVERLEDVGSENRLAATKAALEATTENQG